MFSCDQCAYKTKTAFTLEEHNKVLHTDDKFICNECGFQTSYKQSLTQHKKSLYEGESRHGIVRERASVAHRRFGSNCGRMCGIY